MAFSLPLYDLIKAMYFLFEYVHHGVMISVNIYQLFNSCTNHCLSSKINSELSEPVKMKVMQI